MHKSVWSDVVKMPSFEKLRGEKKCDVLVIGGGICGILCAKFLQDANIDYILVEGDKIASGITKNTTAKITSQHGMIYSKLVRSAGYEKARMYFEANQKAVSEYEKICRDIDCDFEKRASYIYSKTNRKRIEKEVATVEKLGFNADFSETDELPFETKGAVRFKNQAQFNPLKFIANIVSKLNIYEDTFIRDILPGMAISDEGKIFAEKIIVATHFPFINKHGSYFIKLYQHRSYVSAYENAGKISGMYADENEKGLSFRQYGKLLLVGGGGHRTGKQGGNWREINDFAKEKYAGAIRRYEWATQDCMSLDGIPYIGKYSARTPNLYVATGFNKWGMTSSMVAAEILRDMVFDKENEFSEVFSPQRSILKPQVLINGFESTVNLLTPTAPRCPHLGCSLKYNRAEHTWDCPCHGSRFERDGKLIDNPATGDANIDSEGK